MKKRVGILGIYHESNTFLKDNTSLENFEEGHLLFGEEIREEYSRAFHEVGGMLEELNAGIEAVPLMFAEATPGGIITDDALDYLCGEMFAELRSKGPFDGILAAVHGAAVSESQSDMDGWWLQKLRSFLGPEKSIVGTLDPHANVSQKMINATDALVAYKTNPHIDQRDIGKEAAQIMLNILNNKIQPTQYFFQPKATISIEKQYTSDSPCKELYQLAEQMKKENSKIISVSVLLGFPYSDVEKMGSGFLVVTENDSILAEQSAKKLGDYLWKKRSSFVEEKISVEEAISGLDQMSKPVLLLDMGDNVGGGAPGDSTFILEGLEKTSKWRSFVCIYDPESVTQASESDKGCRISLKIGGKTDKLHGDSYKAEVTIETVTEGVFKEDQPRHGGQVNFNMGKMAIVKTDNGTTIMLTSLRTVPFSLNQLTSFGIKPGEYDVIVAKGVHAPMAAYETVCNNFVRVNTKGITQADMTEFSFFNRRKPLFPFEK